MVKATICRIPARHIDRPLDWEVFKMHRKQRDDEYKKRENKLQISTGANSKPFTRDDFMRDLNRVVRKKATKRRGK